MNKNPVRKPIELSPKTKSLKGILKVPHDFDFKKIVEEGSFKKYGANLDNRKKH